MHKHFSVKQDCQCTEYMFHVKDIVTKFLQKQLYRLTYIYNVKQNVSHSLLVLYTSLHDNYIWILWNNCTNLSLRVICVLYFVCICFNFKLYKTSNITKQDKSNLLQILKRVERKFIWHFDWLVDCCLTSIEEYFSYIVYSWPRLTIIHQVGKRRHRDRSVDRYFLIATRKMRKRW